MTLFPVLDRIQRETKLRGKLRLAQPHPDTQFSHVHLRHRDVGDSHTDWLTLQFSRAPAVRSEATCPPTNFLPAASAGLLVSFQILLLPVRFQRASSSESMPFTSAGNSSVSTTTIISLTPPVSANDG